MIFTLTRETFAIVWTSNPQHRRSNNLNKYPSELLRD